MKNQKHIFPNVIFIILSITLISATLVSAYDIGLDMQASIADANKSSNIDNLYEDEDKYFYLKENSKEIFYAYSSNDDKEIGKILNTNNISSYDLAKCVYRFKINPLPDKYSKYNTLGQYYAIFYDLEKSSYISAIRSNYKMKYAEQHDIDQRITIFDIDSSKLIDDEELVIEFIVNAKNINNIPPSIKISEIGVNHMEYYKYIKNDISKELTNLSNDIRANLKSSDYDNLRALSEANINWILKNLYYVDDYDKHTREYCHVDNTSKTINLGLGVCIDFVNLLTELFNAQGIPARMVAVNLPGQFDSFGTHANVEVFDGESWHMLNPTLYNLENKRILKLKDGNQIVVLNPLSINYYPRQYFKPLFTLNNDIAKYGRYDFPDKLPTNGLTLKSRKFESSSDDEIDKEK